MKSVVPNILADNPLAERFTKKLAGDRLTNAYYGAFFKSIKDRCGAENQQQFNKNNKILLYSGISSMYLTPIEILFYHGLRKKGFDVDYLVYDETLSYNEITTKERRDAEGDKFWRRSCLKGLNILQSANVEYQKITVNPQAKAIVDSLPNDAQRLFEWQYDNYDIGKIVKGVMYRYYKSITMDDDAPSIAKQFMITTLTNYFEIKKRCENNQYHAVMFSHGIYCTWQIVVDYCKNNSIDYVCYDRGKTKGCINMNRNNPSPVWDITEAWNRLEKYRLNSEEERKVDKYLKERETQKGDVYAYNFSKKSSDLQGLKNTLGIRPHQKVISIFTNLIWDAANVSRDIAFDSPLDCIAKTIEHYNADRNVKILIRSHPAEKVLGTKERYGELVSELFTNGLPENVTIIDPEMNVNSFSVLEISDIGVVHTSTVGLEMAMEGKPIVLISDTHYRGKGFTFDAESSDHYFDILDRLVKSPEAKKNQIELSRKYFYLMMFEYQHLSPVTFTKLGSFNGYSKSSGSIFEPSEKNLFGRLIDAVATNKSDFIFR